MSDGITHLSDYPTDPRYQAAVVSTELITSETSEEEVRELVLDVDRPDFPYEVGQSIGVLAPGDPALGGEHHLRLYSVADLPARNDAGRPRITIAVRRCSYIDDFTGERHPGVASNFLCDLRPADTLTVIGPFGPAFEVPEDRDATLILIGSGTGIAPFRAFVKHLYHDVVGWTGRVWLFYGAKSGLELLYMNDRKNDFAQYYDRDTFEAFTALSPRPSWADPIGWHQTLSERADDLWGFLTDARTRVYLAGLEEMRDHLDEALGKLAGSDEKWARRKAELMAGGRWIELLY
jgi:ferredoxin--NADP+ reductase